MRLRKAINDQLLAWRMDDSFRRLRQSLREFLLRCLGNRMVVAGLIIILAVVLLAICAPILPLADPTPSQLNPEEMIKQPSGTYWFGTDELGRDIFSRVIWGARTSLAVAMVAVFLSLVIGVVLGLTAGYFGGKVDYLIAGTIDLFWTFPAFLLALALAAALGPSLKNVILAISISYWAGFARLMRGQALTVRERLFVEASRALGANSPRIMFRHVLPNCLAPLIVWASIGVADAITIESSLSFLGVGTQPPTPSWGYMLYRGIPYLAEAPWIATFPGIVLLITILGFNLLGDGMRDVLDPRMKGMRR